MNGPQPPEQQAPATPPRDPVAKMTPGPVASTLRTVDVDAGGGSTIRVSLTPDALVLAHGFGGGASDTPFNRSPWGSPPLTLPARILGPLRDALDALDALEGMEPPASPAGQPEHGPSMEAEEVAP